MPKYYVLNCVAPIGVDHFLLQVGAPANDKRWKAGLLFSDQNRSDELQPPPQPIVLRTQPEEGPIPNTYAELYWNPIPLMSRRLVTVLQSAGVDNLQTYETRLESIEGDKPPPPNHYLAVNIVGRVAAADLTKSEMNPESPDRIISTDFNSLSIDEAKARNLLMFRLAENISAVLVHERVREQVERRGIDLLTWYDPAGWAG
jgi:hypothetical protein